MFEAVSRKFQIKFKNRAAAGSMLGEILRHRLKGLRQNIVVLGIPRGGVITADTVFSKLASPSFSAANAVRFGIITPRKLTDPDNKEHAIGAIMEDGTTYLDEEMIRMMQITPEYLEKEKVNQIEGIKRRAALYSINTTIRKDDNNHKRENLGDKITILVDDGAATGATLAVAAKWVKTNYTPKRLIIAIPVSPKDTLKLLKQEADALEVITSPSVFKSVGQFYQDFEQVQDGDVIEILRNRSTC